MKILFINPNSSDLVTETLRKAAEPLQTESMQIDVVHCCNTPRGIVSSYDELKAGIAVVELLLQQEVNYDGAVIGCFADPGLRAARELIRIPVAGLYESSAIFARMQGRRYSVLASGNEADISPWIGSIRDLGDTDNIASIRYIGSTVEEASKVSDDVICQTIDVCRKKDGADTVILGCAAFAGRGESLSKRTDIPVIDGVEEAVRVIEMMVSYRRSIR